MKNNMTDDTSHTASSSSFPSSGWVETTLGEVVEISSGKSRPKDKGIFPVYGGNGILDYADNFNFEDETIIIGRVGAYCGCVYFEKEKFWLSDNALGIKSNEKSDIKFLYYFLINQNLNKKAIGGAQPLLTQGILNQIKITIPPLPEQQAIASVLSAFDDKIELLREQNKTLEEMGQVMFQEWFGKYGVDDDKVNAEGREGGLGQLPDGWRVFELSEIVDIINGYAYKGSDLVEDSKTALVTLKSFDRNGGFQTRGFKPFIGNPKETQEVKIGDLVVAHTDLTQDAEVLGNPAFIFDDGGFKKMFITMDLVKVISKDENITNAFLYYLMKTKEFKGHCVGYANGTTVLHLSKKAIPEYQIALPNDFGVLSDVSLLLKETTDKIADINSQIQTLENTRDEILPKLMSGMLRVNDFSNN